MAEEETIFYQRLKQLCKERGIVLYHLGEKTGIPIGKSTLARWKTGEAEPRNNTLSDLANYFKVDVDYLLGKKSERNKKIRRNCENCPCKEECDCKLTPQEQELLAKFRATSEHGKFQMIASIMAIWAEDTRN